MKGHSQNTKDIKYKDGDGEAFIIEAQTTDKLLVFASNGRFYTLGCDKLPPGRGFGEPLRLMIELPNGVEVTELILHKPGERFIIAASSGHAFIVKSDDLIAQTKNGKQVLNVSGNVKAKMCKSLDSEHDMIAVIGQNRKLLVFWLEELPEMGRGKGVILQKYKDGGVSDIKSFKKETGLEFKYGSGTTVVEDITPWLGRRASAGKMPPNGFPKGNLFD